VLPGAGVQHAPAQQQHGDGAGEREGERGDGDRHRRGDQDAGALPGAAGGAREDQDGDPRGEEPRGQEAHEARADQSEPATPTRRHRDVPRRRLRYGAFFQLCAWNHTLVSSGELMDRFPKSVLV